MPPLDMAAIAAVDRLLTCRLAMAVLTLAGAVVAEFLAIVHLEASMLAAARIAALIVAPRRPAAELEPLLAF